MKEKIILETSDHQSIHCDHYKNGHDKVIIIAHGFYSHKESAEFINLAESLGPIYDVFIFDFRGHGKSSGFFTWAAREKADLIAVLDYLQGRYAKRGLVAFSLGAFVSFGILAEKKDAVQSFVAISPISKFSRIDFYFWRLRWKEDFLRFLLETFKKRKRVRVGPFWLVKIDPIRIVHRLTVPVFYIHGEKDWVIRNWHSKRLYEKTLSKKKLVFVTDGPHAEYLISHHPEKVEDLIKDWFAETLV
jgi:pimeloyl-ACP methyl ester carboxylesterase